MRLPVKTRSAHKLKGAMVSPLDDDGYGRAWVIIIMASAIPFIAPL